MRTESRIFFDNFGTGVRLQDSSNEDNQAKLFKKLDKGEWHLVRVVKREAKDLVLDFLKPLFMYKDNDKYLKYCYIGELALIVCKGGIEDVVYTEMDNIRGFTIRLMDRSGSEIESTFHKAF
tara:strand:+ start:1413 stop:1778 length:366 start_codon:yes stop_codon:yes gene_type:complete